MASRTAIPQDELVHTEPGALNWWREQGGQPMDENFIHRYLHTSPFFDHTTKNGLHFAHADNTGDPRAQAFVADRHWLEDVLRKQVGTEYMIVDAPKNVPEAGHMLPQGTTGIWVVRKQDRQRVTGLDGRMAEELTTLETYYTLGEMLFKAASVGDTVGNRLLLAQRHIQAFVDTAKALPSFDPAMGGYYYLRPSNKPTTASTSTPGTPARSREASAAAGAGDAHSIRSTSVDLSSGSTQANAEAAQEDRLLRESLGMSVQFGDEYADENPIIGEPGRFSFTSSTAAVKKRKADEEAAAARAKAEREAKEADGKARAQQAGARAPAPPPIMTEAGKMGKGEGGKGHERRGSKMGERVRRKKSKGSALSPTTPGAGAGSSV